MPFQGKWRKLDPEMGDSDSWSGDCIGVIYQTDQNGDVGIEIAVDDRLVEDDGRPFENEEKVEILVRRAK